jgi:hypothetical protein
MQSRDLKPENRKQMMNAECGMMKKEALEPARLGRGSSFIIHNSSLNRDSNPDCATQRAWQK